MATPCRFTPLHVALKGIISNNNWNELAETKVLLSEEKKNLFEGHISDSLSDLFADIL